MTQRRFMDLLAIPWVDKSIALVATIPFVIELYRRWVVGHVNFPRAVLGIQLLVIIVVMVLRTAPVRVTPNPWYWLLAFVTTYATLGFSAYADPGVTLIAPLVGNSLAIVSALIIVYSLLSLGRNIGFIPAQRRLVTRGAYRFVRHPIYTGTFISLLAFVLRAYSPLNLTIAVALIASLMLRGLVEEHFLREDPAYAAYLAEVRWRWFPGIG
jgi:protein-S-isoprenylcysteine O-methyltransferase Ste14